jgi:hypothetical protein
MLASFLPSFISLRSKFIVTGTLNLSIVVYIHCIIDGGITVIWAFKYTTLPANMKLQNQPQVYKRYRVPTFMGCMCTVDTW